MIHIRRYTPSDAPIWDAFVRESRNGTFLFERAYMDYHKDRFVDHSLICTDDKDRIVALLPANEKDSALFSHLGLTYGGFILSPHATSVDLFALFDGLIAYMREHGLDTLHYKPMPTIYHRMPSQEEEYVLWRLGAEMEVCNLSCTIDMQEEALRTKPEYCRRSAYNRMRGQGFTVDWEADLAEFWPILTRNLQEKYGVQPVHTLDEMCRLQKAFPDQILCCVVRNAEGTALGGVVIFESQQVAHLQYSSSTPEGKQCGALDYLYMSLLENYSLQQETRFFDFGTSNEDGGRMLNESLIHYKESFGGRGVVYKQFKLKVKS